MGSLLPLPGPTVGLATNSNTPATTYYSWFKSLFDAVKALLPLTDTVAAILALFPGGTSSAWTDYVPAVTASAGTITTVSATGTYFQVGKMVFLQFTVVITTAGTGAGDLIVTVPVTPVARDQYFGGTTTPTAILAFAGALRAADSAVHLKQYDNTTLIIGGRTLTASGFYEAA